MSLISLRFLAIEQWLSTSGLGPLGGLINFQGGQHVDLKVFKMYKY